MLYCLEVCNDHEPFRMHSIFRVKFVAFSLQNTKSRRSTTGTAGSRQAGSPHAQDWRKCMHACYLRHRVRQYIETDGERKCIHCMYSIVDVVRVSLRHHRQQTLRTRLHTLLNERSCLRQCDACKCAGDNSTHASIRIYAKFNADHCQHRMFQHAQSDACMNERRDCVEQTHVHVIVDSVRQGGRRRSSRAADSSSVYSVRRHQHQAGHTSIEPDK